VICVDGIYLLGEKHKYHEKKNLLDPNRDIGLEDHKIKVAENSEKMW